MSRSHPPLHRHLPSSEIAAFIDHDRIDALLIPWVPDPAERAYVVRCILDEGPAHHRGANYVLLALIGMLLEADDTPDAPVAGSNGSAEPPRAGAVPIPLRLPPHLAGTDQEKFFPLPLMTGVLEHLAPADSRQLEAMVDCLTDGPPQHALANALMVNLLGVLLARRAETGR